MRCACRHYLQARLNLKDPTPENDPLWMLKVASELAPIAALGPAAVQLEPPLGRLQLITSTPPTRNDTNVVDVAVTPIVSASKVLTPLGQPTARRT
jgi:hypothetical protein